MGLDKKNKSRAAYMREYRAKKKEERKKKTPVGIMIQFAEEIGYKLPIVYFR